ncbi:MAG TPA: alkaline phosphatase family protein [Steroidobacteraceae bacterium]|nr:alkaline phosphatase family protein [Steroidobacteraceae bacterium]
MSRATSVSAGVLATLIAGAAANTSFAAEGPVPSGIPHLDHVFVIMMENHSYQQIVGNPAMPFINGEIANHRVNVATRYYAIGHPSLTNYLEIVGGSNFGVRSDASPNWHNTSCQPNLQSGLVNADADSSPAVPPPVQVEFTSICPISGTGTDAATEAVDNWNETAPGVFDFLANIDGVVSVPAAKNTTGETIGDQLVRHGLSWKSYQESLPVGGANLVNNSNGTASNLTTYDPTQPLSPTNLPPLTSDQLLAAYAVKHNPFAYFASVQQGWDPRNSLHNIVGFAGAHGLYADLASGDVPNLSFIAPNQCNDQHGRGNGDAFCQFDFGIDAFDLLTDGTQVGMNPGLSEQADVAVQTIVTAITSSPVWHSGYNAIVVVWDENDYSGLKTALPAGTAFPDGNQNRVVLTVQTNGHAFSGGVQSKGFYTSYSLLKSLESGFRLPCLNHACDRNVNAMSDLFGVGF